MCNEVMVFTAQVEVHRVGGLEVAPPRLAVRPPDIDAYDGPHGDVLRDQSMAASSAAPYVSDDCKSPAQQPAMFVLKQWDQKPVQHRFIASI
jgi:hypothetical protein